MIAERKTFNRLTKLLLLCLILSLLPLSSACRGGTEGKTTLSSIQGEVLVKKARSRDWAKGEINMVLVKGDAIKSGADAGATVTFFDGSTIELKADTQIEVTELVKTQPAVIRLRQEMGETLNKVNKLVDPALRYEIETPTAVAGVRGSAMRVSVVADGTTTVQNLEGQISVTAQGVEMMIPVGGTGTVTPGAPPVLEVSYDDGSSEGGYSLGGPAKYGFLVRFESDIPLKITRIKILSWINGIPQDTDLFTVSITDKDLTPLWEASLPFSLFTAERSWLEVEVPGITVNGGFGVALYAPTLGQGLGPYIGRDTSVVNQHSELLAGWEITPWTLSVAKEQTNWMIRVTGSAG